MTSRPSLSSLITPSTPPSPDRPTVLLADANVLIDYRDSDPAILSLVSEHLGPICVIREVLEEAKGMTLAECREHSITVHKLET